MPGRNKDSENKRPLLADLLVAAAKEQGFPLAGALDLDLALIQKDVENYDQWLASGYAGAMGYLVRGRDRRADPRLVFPEAKSIFCVGFPYSARAAGRLETAEGPRYSRYLRNQDYHTTIAEKLERIMRAVAADLDRPLSWKVCVDSSAVFERAWAALAGLGWVGKNSMLIHPQYGSYFFLGSVLVSEEVDRGPSPLPNYCGNCSRCLQACPPQALIAPRVLDSNRCISYLTLEKRGEFEASPGIKEKMGTWVAGCDLCQEVCPFNAKAAKTSVDAEDGATSLSTWGDLLLEDERFYRTRVKDSSLSRIKPAQFSRNLANALANALAVPQSFSGEELAVLRPLVRQRYEREVEAVARVEWARCDGLLSVSGSDLSER